MQQFINTTLGGLTLGMVYAAFALALVLIWRSTRIVNFAQAPMADAHHVRRPEVIDAGHSYWLGFAAALVAGLVLGAVVERVVIRPVEGGPEINAVILTLGLFVVLHALAAIVFGNRVPVVPGAVRHPRLRGRRHDDRADRLRRLHDPRGARGDGAAGRCCSGSPTSACGCAPRRSTRRWPGCSASGSAGCSPSAGRWPRVVGSLAGLLIAGGSLVHPGYMDSIVVYGFVAAVLGGLDSPVGAVVGGLLLGLALSFVSPATSARSWSPWPRSRS